MEISEKDLKMAQEVYANLCSMLDSRNWKYRKEEDNFVIRCSVQGDDLPMDLIIYIDPARQIIRLISPMPFDMSKEKLIDGAIAVSIANNGLVDGNFDFDISDGSITFRLTASYIDSVIGADLFEYMLMVSAHTVDKYNDQFLMLSKGALDIKTFMDTDKQ